MAAAILVIRASQSLPAAPAAWPWRYTARQEIPFFQHWSGITMLNRQAIPRHPKAVLDRRTDSLLLSSNGSRALLIAATGLVLASCAGGARVEYRDCWTATLRDAGARCGHVAVPGSYSDPTRASRRVAFAIKPPLPARVSGSDPVVFLIGGPGLSATYYSEIDGYDAGDLDFLNQDREVILVDYRGLGESGHVNCVPSPDLSDCIARLVPQRAAAPGRPREREPRR